MKKLLALVLVMAFALIAGGAVADHTDNILYSWTTSPQDAEPAHVHFVHFVHSHAAFGHVRAPDGVQGWNPA